MRRSEPTPTWDDVVALGRSLGLEHMGVAPAAVLERARSALIDRAAEGLSADMNFTYRDPVRSTDPTRAVPGARSVIVAARSYLADSEPTRPDGPQARVARYAWTDHYAPLREALRTIARRLKASGERAVAFADDNSLVDREAAYQGGLGWFGKNANLLLPGAGSWFVLGSIITTAQYEPSVAVADGCGPCRRCIDRCPTGAIVRPGVIDANRCLAWVLQRPGSIPIELRHEMADRIYGCDDCQEVCPPTVHLGRRHARPLDPAVEAWVSVLDLLDATDDELLERHGRWYISGRDPRWLRRNALVVLGNVGSARDQRTARTLARYRTGDDELLAEHAAWASAQLGLLFS